MSMISGPPAGGGTAAPPSGLAAGGVATPPPAAPVAAGHVDTVPVLAQGLELIGEMSGSGYRNAPALVRRADGQTIQLTKLLYLVLEAIDGERSYDQVAEHAGAAFGRSLTGADAHLLINSKLRPLGLVRLADGSEPEVRKANPLLALRLRYVVSNQDVTRRITAPFARLFNPLLVIAVVVAFVLVCKWVLFDRGLAFAAHEAFARPGLLLSVFAITLVSAGFHEFGHAAAARYGGATPGAMGAGVYLLWPVFYTDLTDSYRLGRGGRIRTDLGGLYFNALLSLAMFGLWSLTGWDALLLVIATQVLQMIRQLPPMLRFDGYHLLADITGVPDLFHRIKPTLAGLLPSRWGKPESKTLRPWAKVVVTGWVLLVVPLIALSVLVTVLSLPRILASAAVSLSAQSRFVVERFGAGDVLGGLAKLLAVVAIGLPVLGILYMMVRSVRQLASSVWRATDGKPARRAFSGVAAAVLVVALGFAWWPHGNYRPIQSYERGTVSDLLPAAFNQSGGGGGLHEGRQGSAQTIWSTKDGPLPTADKPVLALLLVPRAKAPDGSTAPTWVFPFNRPLPPGAGDNQTLAVNTTNGTTVYDVAFAMVWADKDTVLNKNEAYAFASCTDCRAAAVSFQVVLIVGQAHVVVPQNISAAVNYNCLRCVTQALAVQLVLTLPGQPSAAETQDINALWLQIQAFGAHLQGLSFAQIHDQLVAFERQIAAVITKDSGVQPGGTAPSGTPAATTGAVGTASGVPGSAGAPSDSTATTPAATAPSSSDGSGASTSPSQDPASSGSASPTPVSSSP